MFRTLFACVFMLVASLTAAPAFSLSSSELVAQATEARDSGSYRNAVRLYKQAADQGSAEAMNALGVLYMRGVGVSQSDKQAFFWIKRAADRGYPAAQKNFGILYAEGIWVKPNKAKAREWMQLAADNGNAEAQAWLDGKPAPAADTQVAQGSSPQSTSTSSSNDKYFESKWKECDDATYAILTMILNTKVGLYGGGIQLLLKYNREREGFRKKDYCDSFIEYYGNMSEYIVHATVVVDLGRIRELHRINNTGDIKLMLPAYIEHAHDSIYYSQAALEFFEYVDAQQNACVRVSGHNKMVNGRSVYIWPYCRAYPSR